MPKLGNDNEIEYSSKCRSSQLLLWAVRGMDRKDVYKPKRSPHTLSWLHVIGKKWHSQNRPKVYNFDYSCGKSLIKYNNYSCYLCWKCVCSLSLVCIHNLSVLLNLYHRNRLSITSCGVSLLCWIRTAVKAEPMKGASGAICSISFQRLIHTS